MAYLQLEGLTKQFPGTLAVDKLDLGVERGDFLVLLGPSGCGKTTTLRIIAGLEVQTDGRIILDNVDISDVPPERRDMAMVFQHLALYPHMSVFDNIAFYLRNTRVPKPEIDERVRQAAARVQIQRLLNRWPSQLSGGEQQRVALAKSLVRSPKAFLLDEPLASLDAKLRASMRSEFKLLHQNLVQETDSEYGTFIYVTHDQVEALTLGTRVAVMNEGKLIQVDSPEDLYRRPKTIFTATFVGSPEMNLMEGILSRENGRAVFTFHGHTIDVGSQGLEVLGSVQEEALNVTLGVRPQSVSIVKPIPEVLNARILTVELLGQNNFVLFRVTDEILLASLTSVDMPLKVGETVGIQFDEGALHFFAPDTGNRL
jgi:multiple sugar transport system ATP-binding protein